MLGLVTCTAIPELRVRDRRSLKVAGQSPSRNDGLLLQETVLKYKVTSHGGRHSVPASVLHTGKCTSHACIYHTHTHIQCIHTCLYYT